MSSQYLCLASDLVLLVCLALRNDRGGRYRARKTRAMVKMARAVLGAIVTLTRLRLTLLLTVTSDCIECLAGCLERRKAERWWIDRLVEDTR